MSDYRRVVLSLLVLVANCHSSWQAACAQEEAPKSEPTAAAASPPKEFVTEAGRRIDVVLEGLKNPSGIAIQPETGTVYISDSGAAQVVRLDAGKAVPVITEFPLAPFSLDPTIQFGPLGLLFMDRSNLLVGCSGQASGEAVLRRFQLPETPEPIKAEAAQHVQHIAPTESSATGPALLYSLTTSLETMYGTVVDDGKQAWIIEHKKNQDITANLDTFGDLADSLQAARPGGATISPHGYLVLGTIGQWDSTGDGLLAFFDTATKKLLMRLETGLHDISSVAYSPRRQMYVLDVAVSKPEDGGLYKIIADSESSTGMKTKKIASLTHPTAMAFDADGALYVAASGAPDEQGNRKGYLLKIPSEENL